MKIKNICFGELYLRHLCRHSEFGLNVLHIAAVAGVYYSLAGLIRALTSSLFLNTGWLPVTLLLFLPYAAILLRFVPTTTAIFSLLIVVAIVSLQILSPPLPIWVHAALILFWHRVQIWSHRLYSRAYDMTMFSGKYPKGPVLFLVLAVFELPLLVHYFLTLSILPSELNRLVAASSDPRPDPGV